RSAQCMMIHPRCGPVRRSPRLISVVLLSVVAAAEETVFRDVQFPSSKGKLTNATLRFSDDDKLVEVRVSDSRVFNVPDARIEKGTHRQRRRSGLKDRHQVSEGENQRLRFGKRPEADPQGLKARGKT